MQCKNLSRACCKQEQCERIAPAERETPQVSDASSSIYIYMEYTHISENVNSFGFGRDLVFFNEMGQWGSGDGGPHFRCCL